MLTHPGAAGGSRVPDARGQAEVVARLRRILGDVGGHGLRVQTAIGVAAAGLPVHARVDRAGVDLHPETEPTHHVPRFRGRRVVADPRGGGANQLHQVPSGEVDRGRRVRVVVGDGARRAVQADQGVEVDDRAALELRDLRERHPTPTAQVGHRQPQPGGQGAGQGNGEPPPQLRGGPLPHHVPAVVVAVRAQRLPQPAVALAVRGHAADEPAVRAPRPRSCTPRVAASRAAVAGGTGGVGGVDRAERRRGQGGEDQRPPGDRRGDALHPPGGTGGEQMPHVALVFMRAARAHRRAPVPAPLVQDPIWLDPTVIARQDLPARPVQGQRRAAQPDRAGAVPGRGGLTRPPVEPRREQPHPHLTLDHTRRGDFRHATPPIGTTSATAGSG